MYTEKKRAEENYPLNDLIICDDNKTVMTNIYSEHSMSQTLPEALYIYILIQLNLSPALFLFYSRRNLTNLLNQAHRASFELRPFGAEHTFITNMLKKRV